MKVDIQKGNYKELFVTINSNGESDFMTGDNVTKKYNGVFLRIGFGTAGTDINGKYVETLGLEFLDVSLKDVHFKIYKSNETVDLFDFYKRKDYERMKRILWSYLSADDIMKIFNYTHYKWYDQGRKEIAYKIHEFSGTFTQLR